MSNERTSLLEDEEHGGSQPGTTSDVSADQPTPMPWHALSVIMFLAAIPPLAFEIVFPFVNQMIVEIGVVTDPERVGYYSGLIESIFSCMSFVTILPSSYLADRIGRKPVMLGGISGLALSVALFGMSKSFGAMVLSRCLGGALGGTWACSKVMIGEHTDRSNQASAFQWLGIAYRIGQILGLPLGGFLAHPERHMSLFQSKFWYEYPFALPCFVASAIASVAVILGYFKLQETLHSNPDLNNKPTYGATGVPPITDSPKSSIRSILTPSIISLLVSNVTMCLASEFLFSVFPLFSFTPVTSGGLGMSTAAIGTQMTIRGILSIVLTVVYAPMERYFGSTVRVYQLTMWLWPLTYICLPILNHLAREGDESIWYLNFAQFVFFLLWSVSGFCWVSISIMVTNAAPSADALATINGLSQMAIVLAQAIAPASVTSLFAASVKSGIARGNLIWIVLFLLTCSAALHSMTLREPRTYRRRNTPD